MESNSIQHRGLRAASLITAVMFIVGLMALVAPSASAKAATTRYVSTTGTDSGDCSSADCATIQYAVGQADDGDTIQVANGTYDETVDVNAKDLTINGQSQAGTIVKAPVSPDPVVCGTPGGVQVRAVVCARGGATLNLSSLTTDGNFRTTPVVISGIAYYNSDGVVTGVTSKNNRANPLGGAQNGNGIQVTVDTGSHSVEVSSSNVVDFQKRGIRGFGAGAHVNIHDNTVTCSGLTGAIAMNGIQIQSGATAAITNNVISGCAFTGGDASTAILLFSPGSPVTIEDNEVSGSDYGLYAGPSGTSDVTVTGNTFTENGVAVSNDLETPIDVSGNTFTDNALNREGNVTGVGNTLYVAPDGDDTDNWCDVPADPCLTIQYAVDQAASGDTIDVADGTYNETVDVNGKDVTIDGASKADTIIKAPASPAPVACGNVLGTDIRAVVCARGGATLTLSDLTADGNFRTSSWVISGVAYLNSDGAVTNVKSTNNRANPLGGVQNGQGIQVTVDSGTHEVEVADSTVVDFQKRGIRGFGAGLTLNVHDNTVTCAGPTGAIAMNGIQLQSGAKGTISDNVVSGCSYAGLDAGGTAIMLYAPGSPITVEGNEVSGSDDGIYAGPDGAADITATDNTLTGNEVAIENDLDTGDIQVHGNRIVGNDDGVITNAAAVDATDNWWGCNEGPTTDASTDCDSISTDVDADPWVVLTLDAPASLAVSDDAPVTAHLDTNSNGDPATVPDGAAVGFDTNLHAKATVAPSSVALSGGQAESTLTGIAPGIVEVTATLDSATAEQNVLITQPTTTTVVVKTGSTVGVLQKTDFVATVSPLPPLEDQGKVAFKLDGVTIGKCAAKGITKANNYKAKCTLKFKPGQIDTHQVTAQFSGSPVYGGSTSAPVTFAVAPKIAGAKPGFLVKGANNTISFKLTNQKGKSLPKKILKNLTADCRVKVTIAGIGPAGKCAAFNPKQNSQRRANVVFAVPSGGPSSRNVTIQVYAQDGITVIATYSQSWSAA